MASPALAVRKLRDIRNSAEFCENLCDHADDVLLLVAALALVLERHSHRPQTLNDKTGWDPERNEGTPVCISCRSEDGDVIAWPCMTIQDVSAALLGEETTDG